MVVSRNANEMANHAGSFDFILDAVAADHDINAYLGLLRRDGNLTLVGAPEKPMPVCFVHSYLCAAEPVGFADWRDCGDTADARFLREANITADVEVIPIQKVNEAYDRLVKADVKYRFSIDMASLRSE